MPQDEKLKYLKVALYVSSPRSVSSRIGRGFVFTKLPKATSLRRDRGAVAA